MLSLASSGITLYAQTKAGAAPSSALFTVGQRIANALVSYVAYMVKMVWPRGLSIVYPHPKSTLPQWEVAGAGLVLALITYAAVRWRRECPYLFVGWFWYLITLAPVIGLVQVGPQAMADRYTYVPLIGLFVIVAWGVPALRMPKHVKAAAAVAVSWLVVLAVCAHSQASCWRDSITLFGHALRVTPRNAIAHMHVGAALQEKGKLRRAMSHYLTALELVPNYDWAHQELGCALLLQGKSEECIYHLREAVRLKPDSTVSLSNLGGALAAKGDLEEGETYLRRAVEADPEEPTAQSNLGHLLFKSQRPDEAVEHLSRAVELAPKLAQTRHELGLALLQTGRPQQALDHLRAVVKLRPKNVSARYAVANTLLGQGETGRAASEFREVLRGAPNHLGALNNLAWIHATDRDPDLRNPAEAVRLAERLCVQTRSSVPQYLDTLAAAYAASGRYGQAAATARKAASLAQEAGQTELAERYKSRAAQYAAHLAPWEGGR